MQNNIKSNLILTKAYCESLLSVKKSNAEILRTIKLSDGDLDLYSFKEIELYNSGKTIITDWKIEPTLYKSNNIETLFKQ